MYLKYSSAGKIILLGAVHATSKYCGVHTDRFSGANRKKHTQIIKRTE